MNINRPRKPPSRSSRLPAAVLRAHAGEAATLMKALGNESRLLILCSLVEGERSVGELNQHVPLSQSALSQQLARLRKAGLVATRRESQTIYYSLLPGAVRDVIQTLHETYCNQATSRVTEPKPGSAITAGRTRRAAAQPPRLPDLDPDDQPL